MRSNDRRRAVLALGASAVVHLAAGVALLRWVRSREVRPARSERRLEVAILERRPERPSLAPPPPAMAAPAAPSPGRRPSRPSQRAPKGAAGQRPSPAPGLGPPLPASRPGPGPGGVLPAPGTPEWLEAEGLSPGEARGRQGALGLVHDDVEIVAGGGPAALQAGPERDPDRLRARIDGWFREMIATDRAHTLPDAYWSGVKERMAGGLEVAWSVLDRGPSDDRVVSGGRLSQAAIAWQREAERWARGAPSPPDDAEARAAEEARARLAAHDLLGAPGRQTALFLTELVTRVELVLEPGGAPSCRVISTSGNPAHDKLVLAHVREVAGRLDGELGPAPPVARTEWSVRSRFEMAPPVPVVGCGFDATFHLAGCTYPLKRTVRTSVRLERVWTQ